MIDNQFLLHDRLAKIRSTISKYGEDNFSISFSGGKDSCVLSFLVDLALPNNQIPRVYVDTGIDYALMRQFVKKLAEKDSRIVIIAPTVPIKPTLEEVGYPFKSKSHSEYVARYQRIGKSISVMQYLGERTDKEPWSTEKSCPQKLRYQFTPDFNIKVSDLCCERLKEEPIRLWQKQNNRPYAITGIMRAEGGRRHTSKCLAFRSNKLVRFNPLSPITKEFEDWLIFKFNIELCDLYKEPYCFDRTGCKGCPFAIKLQNELDILEKFFPAERKQCEFIWEPIYTEYRRIGYRLKETDPAKGPAEYINP